MSRIEEFELKIEDPAFQLSIKKHVEALEALGVFEYLRVMSDKKTSFVSEVKADINGLVVTMSKHLGYAEALDDLLNFSKYSVSIKRAITEKSSYGVRKEDVE